MLPSLTARRLQAQRITTPVAASPADAVRHMAAMQAQDYHAALWAVGLRTADATLTQVEDAIVRGEIVRTWPMRGTLHLLARESGRVFSRDDILNQLRGHEADLYTRAVDIVVSRLRKKLEPLDCIKTLRNAGYSLALRRLVP